VILLEVIYPKMIFDERTCLDNHAWDRLVAAIRDQATVLKFSAIADTSS
jgi:hypothetical protein